MPLLVHDDRLSVRVGAAVLGVTAAAILFVATVLDRLEPRGIRVRVYFSQVSAIEEGARVKVAGRVVGVLTSIALVPPQEVGPGHPLEGTGGIAATLRVDADWARRIPINGEFFITSPGAFAPRYLEIGPPRGQAAGRSLIDGDQVRGVDPPSLDGVLQRAWSMLEDVRRFSASIAPPVARMRDALGRLGATLGAVELHPGDVAALQTSLGAAIDDAVALIDRVGDGRVTAADVGRLLGQVATVADQMAATADDLEGRVEILRGAVRRAGAAVPPDLQRRIDRVTADVTAALAEVGAVTRDLRALIDELSLARGTIGALASDFELTDDVKELTKMLKRQPWRVMSPPIGR